jgi:hypothetical protein
MRREILLLTLVACRQGDPEEIGRRDEVGRAAALDAGAVGYHLAGSPDVRFDWGFSDIQYDPPGSFKNHPFRWFTRGSLRLRSHGAKPMHLVLFGWVDQKTTRTKPVVSVFVKGTFFTSALPDKDGVFLVDTVIAPATLAGEDWVSLTLELSSVGFHYMDLPDLRVAVLNALTWAELP